MISVITKSRNMNNNKTLVTLAIHTNEKAQMLQDVLAEAGVEVSIEKIDRNNPDKISPGVRVRIKEEDLSRALAVVEGLHLFGYNNDTWNADGDSQRILVPVDFSNYSLNACRVAFNMAKEINAKVKIFHAYFSPYYPSAFPIADAFDHAKIAGEEVRSNLDFVKENMNNLLVQIDSEVQSGRFPAANYSYTIREGLAEEEIVAYAKEYKPSLIVMGTKGKGHNSNLPIGSVTAEVLESTSVPILAIPENSMFEDWCSTQHIAFLSNFSQRDLVSFDSMTKLLKDQSVRITLMHLNVPGKKNTFWSEDQMKAVYEYFATKYPNMNIGYKLMEADEPIKKLDEFFIENKVDVVALNTRRRNTFMRIFAPSLSRKILFNSTTALLVLRG